MGTDKNCPTFLRVRHEARPRCRTRRPDTLLPRLDDFDAHVVRTGHERDFSGR